MPDQKSKGSRLKPPSRPPTAVGTIPPEGRTPSKTRRIISFLGAHKSAGKSTIAFYSAVAWADWASSKVLYVPFDAAAGERFCRRLEIDDVSPTVEGYGAQIHLSRYGVGVLSLARSSEELESMNVTATLGLLKDLNRTYDLFIDIGAGAFRGPETLARSVLRESDHAFWITNARSEFLKLDLDFLRRVRAIDSTSGKIDLVANRVGAPGLLSCGGLNRMTDILGTEQIFAVPDYRDLNDWGLLGAADNPKYLQAFRPMLLQVESVRPKKRETLLNIADKSALSKEQEIAIAMSKIYGIPYASRENQILKTERGQNLEKMVPEDFARENLLLPLFLNDKVLAVAIADPDNVIMFDALKLITGYEIQMFVAAKTQIIEAIGEFYGDGSPRA